MVAAQAGDQATYARLLREIAPFLRAIIRRQGVRADEVEDVVQDTLLTLHRVRHTYDPGRPFLPWLAAIARRRAIDGMRRTGRIGTNEQSSPDTLETFADPRANEDTETEDRRDWLRNAMEALPPKQRLALELVKLKDMSVVEAASASGQSAGAVKVNVHRALRTLQALWAGE